MFFIIIEGTFFFIVDNFLFKRLLTKKLLWRHAWSMSLFSGIYNIGIGAGALLGNQVSLHFKMADVGNVGAIIGLLALFWCIFIFRRYPQLRSNG